MSNDIIRRNRLRLKNLKQEQSKIVDKNKKLDALITILFILGLLLTVWEIGLYHRTIIDVKILLAMYFIPGFILTPIFYNKLNVIDPNIEVASLDNVFKLLLTKIGVIKLLPSNFTIPNSKADKVLLIFFHCVLHTCTTGGILIFLFMATNFYFADSNIVEKQFEVQRIDSLPGYKNHRDERKPYAVINYEGKEKELIFNYLETEIVNNAKKVNLSVREGFLGFEILEKYEVIK